MDKSVPGCLREGLTGGRSRVRRQYLSDVASDQGRGVANQLPWIARVNRQIAAGVVEFEQQVGQGVNRGRQLAARFGQFVVWALHVLDEERAIKTGIGDDLEYVAEQVVDVAHVGIEREHEFAHRHDRRRGEKPAGVIAARRRQAAPEHRGGGQVEHDQGVFEADLEACQPFTRDKGARNGLGSQQQNQVNRRDGAEYQHERGPARAQALPFDRPQCQSQQGERGHAACGQPEIDGLLGPGRREERWHAVIGQRVTEVEDGHAEKQACCPHECGRGLRASGVPADREDRHRHRDRGDLEDGVQR